jgi:hypothetical protein
MHHRFDESAKGPLVQGGCFAEPALARPRARSKQALILSAKNGIARTAPLDELINLSCFTAYVIFREAAATPLVPRGEYWRNEAKETLEGNDAMELSRGPRR